MFRFNISPIFLWSIQVWWPPFMISEYVHAFVLCDMSVICTAGITILDFISPMTFTEDHKLRNFFLLSLLSATLIRLRLKSNLSLHCFYAIEFCVVSHYAIFCSPLLHYLLGPTVFNCTLSSEVLQSMFTIRLSHRPLRDFHFWDITPSSSVNVSGRFGRAQRLSQENPTWGQATNRRNLLPWNWTWCVSNYTALYPRRQNCSHSVYVLSLMSDTTLTAIQNSILFINGLLNHEK
jgi:hypothetical protein